MDIIISRQHSYVEAMKRASCKRASATKTCRTEISTGQNGITIYRAPDAEKTLDRTRRGDAVVGETMPHQEHTSPHQEKPYSHQEYVCFS
eukprot:9494698-Pyramimonas_sp.AAC.1